LLRIEYNVFKLTITPTAGALAIAQEQSRLASDPRARSWCGAATMSTPMPLSWAAPSGTNQVAPVPSFQATGIAPVAESRAGVTA